MRRDFSKRCFLSLALLLLVSCSLLAFPGRVKRVEAPTQTQTPIETVVQTEETELPTGSTEPEIYSIDDVEATPAIVEAAALVDEVSLSDDERDELMDIVREAYADQMAAEDEISHLTDRIDELEAVNADQADTIARETGSKAYARLTSSVGFEDGLSSPSLWLGGAVGARLGSGLLVDVGAEYKVAGFGLLAPVGAGVENLRLTASIGWEW